MHLNALPLWRSSAAELTKIKQLELDAEDLEKQVESQAKCSTIEKRETERREQAQKHEEQVAYLKKANEQLKLNLENLLSISGPLFLFVFYVMC